MHLANLSLLNFKNYREVNLSFSSRINCFAGKNGQGKTNLLDAIYYLSFCKSFFNAIDTHHISHGENLFTISGTYQKNGETENIFCGLKRNQKKVFKRNKKEYEKLASHIGLFPLIMIAPEDIELVAGGSELRRKFIDGLISQFDKLYLNNLLEYQRALSQRNILLKQFSDKNIYDEASLEIWDEQLTEKGNYIFEKRNETLKKLIPVFQHYYETISEKKESVQLIYHSQLQQKDFKSLLKESRQRDRFLNHTSQGIHKDDLEFVLGEHPLKRIGSQGQQKTYLIALKLAQYDFIRHITQQTPILLLDDVFDKLDESRVKQLMNIMISNQFGQIFITDVSAERMNKILSITGDEYKIFEVNNGEAN
jgi:DNA replication and repair protein RecF